MLDMTCCSQHSFKSPTNPIVIMPNEGDGNDPGQREQGTKGWKSQGRHGRSQRRQGNRGTDLHRGRKPRFEGREPRLQGHIYDWMGE